MSVKTLTCNNDNSSMETHFLQIFRNTGENLIKVLYSTCPYQKSSPFYIVSSLRSGKQVQKFWFLFEKETNLEKEEKKGFLSSLYFFCCFISLDCKKRSSFVFTLAQCFCFRRLMLQATKQRSVLFCREGIKTRYFDEFKRNAEF
jgi:hypothetical protein